ncbi:MAG: hypothetical protein ACMG6E_00850 [Candidatus Roizmanbacteria bacterium]
MVNKLTCDRYYQNEKYWQVMVSKMMSPKLYANWLPAKGGHASWRANFMSLLRLNPIQKLKELAHKKGKTTLEASLTPIVCKTFVHYFGKLYLQFRRTRTAMILMSEFLAHGDLDDLKLFKITKRMSPDLVPEFPDFKPVKDFDIRECKQLSKKSTYYQGLAILYGYLKFVYGEDMNDESGLFNNHKMKTIAQLIMRHEGRPLECPDEMVPCFGCSPQSPAKEIIHNILNLPTPKDTFHDLLEDCKKTYLVDPKTKQAICIMTHFETVDLRVLGTLVVEGTYL